MSRGSLPSGNQGGARHQGLGENESRPRLAHAKALRRDERAGWREAEAGVGSRELLPQPALTPALSSEPLGPHAGLWHLPCGPESVRLSGPQAPSSASQSRVKVGWTLAARRPCPAPCPGQSCGVRSLTAAPSGHLPRCIPPFTALSFLQRCPPPLCLPPCPSVPRTRVLLPPLAPDLCAQEALPCCPRGPAAWRGD